MTNSMRAEAKASGDEKLRRMGLKVRTSDLDNNEEYGAPTEDGTAGVAKTGYADAFRDGDKAVGRKAKTQDPISGGKSKARLDRPAYARGGTVGKAKGKGTTVNVVIAPQGSSSPGGMPVPPAAMVPPPPLPPGVPPVGGPPAGGAPAVPPGLLGRKRGGRVAYDAGAGSGEGRLEKIKAYGGKAKR